MQAQQWVQENGHPVQPHRPRRRHQQRSTCSTASNFKTLEAVRRLGLGHAQPHPVRRPRHAPVDVGCRRPCRSSNVQYYIANYQFIKYVPLCAGAGRSPSSRASTTARPSETPRPCRPTASSSAAARTTCAASARAASGPKDQFGNPYGGNLRITSQNELHLPDARQVGTDRARERVLRHGRRVPDRQQAIKFYGPDGVTPESYNLTSFSDLKRSVGVAVQWLAPLGLFRFSFGMPLNAQYEQRHHHLG